MIGKQLNIRITEFCNANCSFCGYRRDEFQKKIKNGYKPFVLDLEKFQDKFVTLKKKGFQILHITGGEPFMYPKIKDFILLAKEHGFMVKTGTNGSILNEDIVRFIKESGLDYLWFSLDTFPVEKHLEHRGLSRFIDKFVQGIELLKEYKVNFFGQTVLSKVIPFKNGKMDIEGHINYYLKNFSIDRFVFSYPMIRDNHDVNSNHLASIGSDEVSFTKNELRKLFNQLLNLKKSRKDVTIVNPYVSLWQQFNELEGKHNGFGCFAGQDIFFLGDDQNTLRPCYYFSDKIIDDFDSDSLTIDSGYETCVECQDQCFRDISFAYFVKKYPAKFLKQLVVKPDFFKYSVYDIWNLIKNGKYKS